MSAQRRSEIVKPGNVNVRNVSRRDNGTFFAVGGIGRSAVGSPTSKRLLLRIGTKPWIDEAGSSAEIQTEPLPSPAI
ncbi:hypothetical protein SAMN05444581_10449 [Methylocapsa palsarum]|uniref:Uncharacterized protein n=1 Tax=Methylocapsa palsarum TaxID=1612308 RepID=A0A1I3XS49_9HYPH|nr:hypothetical protein SAMN05444581_10449 [Methylocapsa palsarum]